MSYFNDFGKVFHREIFNHNKDSLPIRIKAEKKPNSCDYSDISLLNSHLQQVAKNTFDLIRIKQLNVGLKTIGGFKMNRLPGIELDKAEGKAKELIDGIQGKLGSVPNIFASMANSPAVLQAYLNFSGALGEGNLDAKLREQIALAVGQENSCDYCLAAHSAIGQSVGLNEDQIKEGRKAASGDAKINAALVFSKKLVQNKGNVADGDIQQLRDAGYSNGDIAEIVANVSLNIFTNYFNHVASLEIDFPAAQPLS